MSKPIKPSEISSEPITTLPIEIVIEVMNNMLLEKFEDPRIQKSVISKKGILDLIYKRVLIDKKYYITYNFSDWKILADLYRAEGWHIHNVGAALIFFRNNPMKDL